MRLHLPKLSSKTWSRVAAGLTLGIVLLSSPWWFPALSGAASGIANHTNSAGSSGHDHGGHEGHDDHDGHEGHDHAGHSEADSIELSPQARKNIQLKTGEIALSDYAKSITIPAVVVEKPGESSYQIAAPLTGIVTGVYVIRGQAVQSGDLLFILRLTHEDLVKAQTEFLQLLGSLDVEQKELNRLKSVASGAIAGKVILEREYEIDKIEAQLAAQREALQLHGLTKEQVQEIVEHRELIREVRVYAPFMHPDASIHSDAEPHARHTETLIHTVSALEPSQNDPHVKSRQFVVQSLRVDPGEVMQAGQQMCVLVDYSELYIEGSAFQQDSRAIVDAANDRRAIMAIAEDEDQERIPGLHIVYVSNEVNTNSRALHFYVGLPNQVVRHEMLADGKQFLTWAHKPGQRMQLRVPVNTFGNAIVLPVDAVAEEGPERYVFIENGDHFDRRPVHVLHRDQFQAVIANDGSVFPGDMVALSGAHQLQMALKNKAGGAPDPHAGHNH